MESHTPEYTAWLADVQPHDTWKAVEQQHIAWSRTIPVIIGFVVVRKTPKQLVVSALKYDQTNPVPTPEERRYRLSDGQRIGDRGSLPSPASAEEIKSVLVESSVFRLWEALSGRAIGKHLMQMHQSSQDESLAKVADLLGWPLIAKGMRGEIDL